MASRKHHKQDATRPTKAREKRLRDGAGSGEDLETDRPATAANGES